MTISASEVAFGGAVEAAELYRASAKGAGININVVQEPSAEYWSTVWQNKPWCACHWSGRVTEDWMFSTAYQADALWNDTSWDHMGLPELLLSARAELDNNKRRQHYRDMQEILRSDGPVIVPMFANYVQALSNKIGHGDTVGNLWQMDNARMAERWWMA